MTTTKHVATLVTTASAGHLQAVAAKCGLWGSLSQGRHCTWTVATDNRYGPHEMRTTRDALRRCGERAWIEVD